MICLSSYVSMLLPFGGVVAGALSCDAAAILVKTGKFQETDLSREKPKPDLVLDSIASLSTALGVKFG